MPVDRKRKAGSKTLRKRSRTKPSTTVAQSGRIGRWREAARELTRRIRTGELAEGERLPKETELAQHYGLSRHSLRRALAELARQGLIETTPRVGARVAPLRVPYILDGRSRFFENIESSSRRPGGRLLSSREGIAPPEIADLLAVARRTTVLELHALRSSNDVPLMLTQAWVPADRFRRMAELFNISGSFTRAFSQLGIRDYQRRSTRVTARAATADERKLLRLEPGAVVLITLGLDVDASGEPIKVSQSVFAADRVELRIGS